MILIVFGLLAALMVIPITFAAEVVYLGRAKVTLTVGTPLFRRTLTLWDGAEKRSAGRRSAPGGGKGRFWLSVVVRANHARRFLLRHTRLEEATLRLRLSLSDAARTASLTGLIRGLTAAVPPALRRRVTVLAQPDFLSGHTAALGRCIVRVRLGTLLITGFMAAMALAAQRRAQPSLSKEA